MDISRTIKLEVPLQHKDTFTMILSESPTLLVYEFLQDKDHALVHLCFPRTSTEDNSIMFNHTYYFFYYVPSSF